jgi:hypothetical protein
LISVRKEPGDYIPGDIKSGRGKEGGDDDHDGRPNRHYAVQIQLYVDILEAIESFGGTSGLLAAEGSTSTFRICTSTASR